MPKTILLIDIKPAEVGAMFLKPIQIGRDSFVADIVKQDYRTAAVFQRHGIEYCCGGRWPLSIICENKGIELEDLRVELENAIRPLQVSSALPFEEWSIDFLTDYIMHVHHQYLRDNMPFIETHLERFVTGHSKKYPHLQELQKLFRDLQADIEPHLRQEEEVLFPYVRQIAHAYDDSEPYAGLLVRTLRKPVESIMNQEHEKIMQFLTRMRQLTHGYTPPENACVSHGVACSLLQELDNDLVQHLYLENEVLFPKAIAMEKELLKR